MLLDSVGVGACVPSCLDIIGVGGCALSFLNITTVGVCVPPGLDMVVGVRVSAFVAKGKGGDGLFGLHVVWLGVGWVGVEEEERFERFEPDSRVLEAVTGSKIEIKME